MKVISCYKVVPDGQDAIVRSDRSLDLSKAQMIIGEYDLLAIEEGVRIAEATGGSCSLLSLGASNIDDSKLIKSALSRGADNLYMILTDEEPAPDAYRSASTLAAALGGIDFDLVLCGEGSADLYAQQVGLQLGEQVGIPVFNRVSKITPQGQTVVIERSLEDEVEVLEVELPAVLSVTSDINLPRIPQLKDILAAGKKPVTRFHASDLSVVAERKVEIVSTLAPVDVDRKHVIFEDDSDDSIKSFVQYLRKQL